MSADEFADVAMEEKLEHAVNVAIKFQEKKQQKRAEFAQNYTLIQGLPITFQIPAAQLLPGSQPILVKDLNEAHLTKLGPSSRLSEAELTRAEAVATRMRNLNDPKTQRPVAPRTVVTLSALPADTTIEHILRSLKQLIQDGKMSAGDSRVVDARLRESRNRDKSTPVDTMVARVEFAKVQAASQLVLLIKHKQVQINGGFPRAVVSGSRGTPNTPFVGASKEVLDNAGGLVVPNTPARAVFDLPMRTVLDSSKRLYYPVRKSHMNYNREAPEADYDEAELRMGVDYRDTLFSEGANDALSGESQVDALVQAYEASTSDRQVDASQQNDGVSTGGLEFNAPESADLTTIDDHESVKILLDSMGHHYQRQIEGMAAAHKREMDELKVRLEKKLGWQMKKWRHALDRISELKLAIAGYARLEQEARTKGWLSGSQQADEASSGDSEF